MPELPEVETVKNSLKKLIINKTIEDVSIYYNKIIKNLDSDDFTKLLKKQTFVDITRKGKYLIFILNSVILVSHLRMEGKYYIKDKGDILKHEHVVFTFTDNQTLRYHDTRKFGTMYLFNTTDIGEVLKANPLNKVGSDPFDTELSLDQIFEKFQRITKPIKSTLLDQTIISGIGNIYVDEICFMSEIHPTTSTKTLSKEQLCLIIENAQIVLDKAILLGGTTIRSFTSSHEISGKFQNELLVHTKEFCPVCNRKITKIRVGGRGTYFCENCQKKLDNEK